ncbi:MAG: beta-hydroxyacyl-ACP dehydratase [Planctomycetota bacterium]
MWIDRVLELVPRERIVAVKNVSLAEEHLHDHFPGEGDAPPLPLMPGSLIIEGMAQTSGLLVGHASGFREKVVLAKISKAELDEDAPPGCTLIHRARIERMDTAGASTRGTVEVIQHTPNGPSPAREIGRIDLLFSHVDQNRSGLAFPEHNFVFGEAFKTLLTSSGIETPA